ncbi:tRNA 2-thiouridine(34) synthase MnmA [Patescibacteria group bacterium]|nr:tRNA 2-thiouridine(34) synthase MnmA [Patescibacteria group bacterium]
MVKQVFVGMSGGVDSSLAAALLKERGYLVTGVFMKNWTLDLPGHRCSWEEDFKDAKRVAVQLNIPFKTLDFEQQYREKVVDYMLEAYARGLTPNPDVMCNQEIKFKLFFEAAKTSGADLIATGHYAQTRQGRLFKGTDPNKDQSYFLYRVSSQTLKDTLFPLGGMHKSQVRAEAQKRGLVTANKPDSQGICFVGEVGIKQFLQAELGLQQEGNIIDQHDRIIGRHDGAMFFTIGQRHGLNVGGGLPYYVTYKDMSSNEVHVSSDLADSKLWSRELKLGDLWWINDQPKTDKIYQVKCRYRTPATSAQITISKRQLKLTLNEEIRAASPGQSAVIYDEEEVIGGGIIQDVN